MNRDKGLATIARIANARAITPSGSRVDFTGGACGGTRGVWDIGACAPGTSPGCCRDCGFCSTLDIIYLFRNKYFILNIGIIFLHTVT